MVQNTCTRCHSIDYGYSDNHLVLSWTLSTSMKSTLSPDRMLSFDVSWRATQIGSSAGPVISLMFGFRSNASHAIFLARAPRDPRALVQISSVYIIIMRSENGGRKSLIVFPEVDQSGSGPGRLWFGRSASVLSLLSVINYKNSPLLPIKAVVSLKTRRLQLRNCRRWMEHRIVVQKRN